MLWRFRPRAMPGGCLVPSGCFAPCGRAFRCRRGCAQEAVAALGPGRGTPEAVAAALLGVDHSGPRYRCTRRPGWCAAKRDASINRPLDQVSQATAMGRLFGGELRSRDGRPPFSGWAGPLEGIDRRAIGALVPHQQTPPSRCCAGCRRQHGIASRPISTKFGLLWEHLQPPMVLGVGQPRNRPRLNIGEESCRAMTLTGQGPNPLLAGRRVGFAFAGNCERPRRFPGQFAVVVCGTAYTGKTCCFQSSWKSVGGGSARRAAAETARGRRGKVGSASSQQNLVAHSRNGSNHAEHFGGALLLGVNGIGVHRVTAAARPLRWVSATAPGPPCRQPRVRMGRSPPVSWQLDCRSGPLKEASAPTSAF